jgi:hypothetical protein
LTVLVALGAAALSCAGPRVSTSDLAVHASPLPGHQRVELTLSNRGGEGEARVTVRLRRSHDGALWTASKEVELEAGARTQVVLDVPAPAGDYLPSVEVAAPPQ